MKSSECLGSSRVGRPAGYRREIDLAVRELLADALCRATEILKARRTDLDKGVALLLSWETLTADDFPAIRPQQRDDRTLAVRPEPFRLSRRPSKLQFDPSQAIATAL